MFPPGRYSVFRGEGLRGLTALSAESMDSSEYLGSLGVSFSSNGNVSAAKDPNERKNLNSYCVKDLKQSVFFIANGLNILQSNKLSSHNTDFQFSECVIKKVGTCKT